MSHVVDTFPLRNVSVNANGPSIRPLRRCGLLRNNRRWLVRGPSIRSPKEGLLLGVNGEGAGVKSVNTQPRSRRVAALPWRRIEALVGCGRAAPFLRDRWRPQRLTMLLPMNRGLYAANSPPGPLSWKAWKERGKSESPLLFPREGGWGMSLCAAGSLAQLTRPASGRVLGANGFAARHWVAGVNPR